MYISITTQPHFLWMMSVAVTRSFSGGFIIDRVAGAIIHLVASVCVSFRLSVGAVLFESFDL